MTSPPVRKALVSAHVATSVGWLGAVAAYVVLDITTAVSADADLVRSSYAAMRLVARNAIAPLAVASVLIGTVTALSTPWGLVRHYWVLAKLAITLIATGVLLLELSTIDRLAVAARAAADPRVLPSTLPHSVGGLVVLLIALLLSTYKPRGVTRYGWRRQQAQRASR